MSFKPTKIILALFYLAGFTPALYAQEAVPRQSPFGSFFPLIVIFGIFYFLLIRPQQKKAKEHQIMLNSVKKDDKIITNGGLYGTVVNVKGNVLEVKIADGVKVQISKSAISNVVTNSEQVVTPEVVK
ncbi:MAG: preprotein translocase subunit YajC [Endomicrobiales bacterium]|nr:preprotein translocase subunit YajC [Endomicrobiales bacterium]